MVSPAEAALNAAVIVDLQPDVPPGLTQSVAARAPGTPHEHRTARPTTMLRRIRQPFSRPMECNEVTTRTSSVPVVIRFPFRQSELALRLGSRRSAQPPAAARKGKHPREQL